MESYNVLWKTSSTHDLRKIDRQSVPQIVSAVESLAENPFPHNAENYAVQNRAIASELGTIEQSIRLINRRRQ
jgi:mRNA-degrading endonuclease RelE of RelBE toxin-antitoxin system